MSPKIYDEPKRPGGEKRGSAASRRARRVWIVSPAAGFGGDGVKVPCVWCGALVTKEELHVDRIIPGGSYRRDNVQPSCAADNQARGTKTVEMFIEHTRTTRTANTTTTSTTTIRTRSTTRTR